MKPDTQAEIQKFHELEEVIETKLEEIRAANPDVRNGLLYRFNVSCYRTLKNQKRSYEERRLKCNEVI